MSTIWGWGVFAFVASLYCWEIVSQLVLLARYLEKLPAARRAALPRHPRDPRWAVFGSARFFWAVFRDATTAKPDDDAPLMTIKKRMRRSAARELLGALATLGTWYVLRARGWEPWS